MQIGGWFRMSTPPSRTEPIPSSLPAPNSATGQQECEESSGALTVGKPTNCPNLGQGIAASWRCH
jgi:hypothetical protein